MTHAPDGAAPAARTHRFRRPLSATLGIALVSGTLAVGALPAAAETAADEWTYTVETLDTGVRNGYQLAFDTTNRKVYFSDAAWSTQTRTVTQETEDGELLYGETDFTVGSGKLAVLDAATRERLADHSYLDLTRNDGSAKESEPFSWEGISVNWGDNTTYPRTATQSVNSMPTTFSPYGVAVDGALDDPVIITTTARQRSSAGHGGGLVVYNASQGAPTDADRIFEFEDGTPVLQGPRRIAVNTVTHKAYVTSLGTQRNNGPDGGYITEIDLVTKQVTARIQIPAENGVYPGVVGVAVDEENNRIYSGSMVASKLYVIDGDAIDRSDPKDLTLNAAAVTQLVADLPANQRPTYDTEQKRLYVASYASPAGTISVVDADPSSSAYGTVIDTITTGPTNAVEVDGERGLLYSANLADKNVVVFDTTTHEQLLTLPTSGNAVNIGIDPVTHEVWVSNFSSTAKVDVFTVTAPGAAVENQTETQAYSGQTGEPAGVLLTPTEVPLGADITISGKDWFLQDGSGGSGGPIFINQGSGSTGTGAVNVNGKREIENQIPGSTFSDVRAHGIFHSDSEGTWSITIPFPTPDNSSLTEETAWKVGDVQYIRVLTGSLVSGDHVRTVYAPFTVVAADDEPTGPVEDQADVTVPTEWVEGESLSIEGTGWTWEDGTTGSTIGVKLNAGALVPVGDPYGDRADNVYAIVEAADATGAWSVELPFPGEGAVEPGNTPAKAGDEITVHFLTGGLAPGDRIRSVSRTVTVVPAPVLEATTSPSVVGSPVVGQKLTADPGVWSQEDVTFAYQWLADGKEIAKATGTTHTVTAAEVGKRLSVRVTATKDGFDAVSATSEQTAAVSAASAPTATGKPSISGTAAVGSTLTAKPGSWSVSGLSFSYQWLRNGSPVSGAVTSTYKVTGADAGASLSVRVTATKAGLADGVATSSAVTVGKALTATPTPSITGSAKVGKTLKVKTGSWKPATVTLKYQWLRDGKPIAKATKSSYRLAKADAGRRISVAVTGSKSGYTSVTRTSRTVSVAKVKASVKLSVPSKVSRGKRATIKVTVSAASSKPTGKVTVKVNGKTVTAKLTASAKGKVSVKLPAISQRGTYKVSATFTPTSDTARTTTTSATVRENLRVR